MSADETDYLAKAQREVREIEATDADVLSDNPDIAIAGAAIAQANAAIALVQGVQALIHQVTVIRDEIESQAWPVREQADTGGQS